MIPLPLPGPLPWALRNWKLILVGLGTATLVIMLVFARADARHWKLKAENIQARFDLQVSNYRAAAEQAKANDLANAARVKAEQQQITQEVSHDYESRLADARKRADDLRLRLAAQANPRPSGSASVPALPAAPGGADEAAENRFSLADRLLATEQAIRLDELQSWVERQARVDVNAGNP